MLVNVVFLQIPPFKEQIAIPDHDLRDRVDDCKQIDRRNGLYPRRMPDQFIKRADISFNRDPGISL